MSLSRSQMIERMTTRDRNADGRFITGVLSTGIYCLPSCPARNPKPENVRFFDDPQSARAAGLRPCKRCRPDDFYRRHDPDRQTIEDLAAAVRAEPSAHGGVEDLAAAAGMGTSKLNDLFRRHFHETPARFLTRARIAKARHLLLEGDLPVTTIGWEVGYDSLSAFNDAFRRTSWIGPTEYRALRAAQELRLHLPEGFRLRETLAYLGRDPNSRLQAVDGTVYTTTLAGAGGPTTLEARFGKAEVAVRLEGPSARDAGPAAHRLLLRRLGLGTDPAPFERRTGSDPTLAPLIQGRRGLRVPLAGSPFEGLVWAILGQQINLAFAYRLQGRLLDRLGTPAGERFRLHPEPEAVAGLTVEELQPLQFSRSKALYLIGSATAMVQGQLQLATKHDRSAVAVEEELLAQRGIGPWSAHYVMMRGLGFADCVPVGDAGLNRGLRHFFDLADKPTASQTLELMEPFTPYRTLATFHLWQLLEDVS